MAPGAGERLPKPTIKFDEVSSSRSAFNRCRKKKDDEATVAANGLATPKPRINANPITIDKPVKMLNIGELSLTGIAMNAAGRTPPVCEPIAPRPYVRPILKMHIPRIDKVNP